MRSIPSRRLDEICTFVNGGTPSKAKKSFFEGTIPWITSADISQGKIQEARSFITEEAIRESSTNLVDEGNLVLVTRTGVGKVAILEYPICFSQDITAICPDRAQVYPGYLAHFLRNNLAYFVSQQRGATIQGISRDVVGSLVLPLPTLAQQRRIAEILARAEALRAKRRAAIAMLDELTQTIFIEMFGASKAKSWPTATIADIASPSNGSIRTGPFGSQLLHSEFINDGIAVLGIDNAVENEFRWSGRRFISERKYGELKRYTVRPGDVLITIMGTCGRCAVVPDDIPTSINTKHLCCITLDLEKCLPGFLHAYFLRHPQARQYLSQTAKGAIMEGLNMGIIKGMPLHLPPLGMQRIYVERVSALERLKNSYRASLAELDTLFTSLQHRAFRGEL